MEAMSLVTAFTSSAISCFGAWSFCSRVDEHAVSPSSSISFGFVVETWVIDPQLVRGITQDFTGKNGRWPNPEYTYRSAERVSVEAPSLHTNTAQTKSGLCEE